MKIVFISIYSFPHGMASSTRIASITRGLVKLGVDTTVIIPEAPEPHNSKSELADIGVWNGVKYVHMQGRKRNSVKLFRGLAIKTNLRFWRGVCKTKRWLKKNPADVVFLYMDDPKYLKEYVKICKYIGAKVLFNFDEYPVPIREQGASELPQWKVAQFKKILGGVDGYISINQTLSRFYNDIVKKPTLEMSMVVDTDRFNGKRLKRNEWMTYMGQILPDKDNIANIVKAFKLIEAKYPNLTFHIYGKAPVHVKTELEDLIIHLNLTEKIFFEGFALTEDVPNIMARSKILVSSQPNNDRVRGCLSTKLAEYVAMGTPTLMCDVGENKRYLTQDDCIFTIPDNPDEYAKSLDYILSNYFKCEEIANHGRNTIRLKYSYMAAAKNLVSFIERQLK